jgi:hypothetical protein
VGSNAEYGFGAVHAENEFVLAVGAALGEHGYVAERPEAALGRRSGQYRRKVIGDDDSDSQYRSPVRVPKLL